MEKMAVSNSVSDKNDETGHGYQNANLLTGNDVTLERSENLTLNGQGTTGKLLSQILNSNGNVAIQMRQIEKRDIPMRSLIMTSSSLNSAKISNTQATISQSLTPSKIDTAKLSQTASNYMMSQILTSQAATLMMPHPILQQIQSFNVMYPNTGVVLQQQTSMVPTVDLTEQDEIGKMKDDGIEESVR